MPIHVDAEVEQISHDCFMTVAYEVTGIAFDIHNKYGSMFGEKLYKHQIADECKKRGLSPVAVEVPIALTYGGFKKEYFADLLVERGALFELKVAATLNDEHRAQTLTYLFMMALHQAKLINVGSPKVQHEFVSTTLTPAERRRFAIHGHRWRATNRQSIEFRELLVELLNDWGGFLQLPAYYDAITHFFGGRDVVIREIPIVRDGGRSITQNVHLLEPATAFKLTAIENSLDTVEEHMFRFLRHTKLESIQWVNLHHHDITFTTLINH